MINSLLSIAASMAFEEILKSRGIACIVRDDEEYQAHMKAWNSASESDRKLSIRQALPAAERIASKEPFLFEQDGGSVHIRFNYLTREYARDSFGDMMLERPDIDWHIGISIKNDARVISSMLMADRANNAGPDEIVNMFNEIDDFGERIFQVPCSNEYFKDMNEILLTFEPYTTEEWMDNVEDDEFLYGKLITPMLRVVASEIPRICRYHPEAPRKLINYFYGDFDYYYINPIDELEITRIGAVNPRGQLGRIPRSDHNYTARVSYPTQLLDVRLATGPYGELSKDTMQFTFDGGWSLCFTLRLEKDHLEERKFTAKVYMPVTPFGSYRDQVKWAPE